MMSRLYRIFGVLLLAGCATAPPPTAQTQTPAADSLERMLAEERYDEAAAIYLTRASDTEGRERLPRLRDAAWASARAESADLLRQALDLYPDLALAPSEKAIYDSYAGLLLALEQQPAQALKTLETSPRPSDPRALGDYWLAHAMAYRQLDDGAAATAMLVRRHRQLDADGRTANAHRIWALQQESARFAFAADGGDDDDMRFDAETRGWLELGRIARRYWDDNTALEQALNDWQARYRGHPAEQEFLPLAADTALTTLRSAVRQIALLLPTSGRLSGAAQALRDGFLAAHFARSPGQLEIRIYDSSEAPVERYEEALADGAELIVGPLDKASVHDVIRRNNGLLPILALNYLDDRMAPDPAVLQYGLAPEDDARSVAQRALADGHRRALALVSEQDWGKRSVHSFRDTFERGGGRLLDYRLYSGGPADYPAVIQDLLQLDASRRRRSELENLLGVELDAEPVRRQDAQFLFLAAGPTEGRQLRPQLRYYHASDLPIYAGDRIYSGTPQPRLDRDLNGVRFCAMPWQLGQSEAWQARRAAIESAWPERSGRYGRLFAMGHDAYLLASGLRDSSWAGLPEIPGATGRLHREEQNVVRALPCAHFVDGVPQPLPPRQSL